MRLPEMLPGGSSLTEYRWNPEEEKVIITDGKLNPENEKQASLAAKLFVLFDRSDGAASLAFTVFTNYILSLEFAGNGSVSDRNHS
jgi:hypothetical protein